MLAHVELHAPRGVAGTRGETDRSGAVARVLVQAVLFVDSAAAVGVTEVQPKTPVNKYETSLTGEGASHIANMLLM